MSKSLAEALQDVELEPGKSYSLQVRGNLVEVHVRGTENESSIPESEIMLDAWVSLPDPTKGGKRIVTKRGDMPLPPPQAITDDDSAPS